MRKGSALTHHAEGGAAPGPRVPRWVRTACGTGYPPTCLQLPDNREPGRSRCGGIRAGGIPPWWAMLPDNAGYPGTPAARDAGAGEVSALMRAGNAAGVSSLSP
jgi:hypothetical protein